MRFHGVRTLREVACLPCYMYTLQRRPGTMRGSALCYVQYMPISYSAHAHMQA